MGLGKRTKQITATGVALATTGLSSCHDNGAVDPLPPPLECNTVSSGQSLAATAQQAADTVRVTVRNVHPTAVWQVLRVGDVAGGTLLEVALPQADSRDSLSVTIKLASDTTSQAEFRVEAQLRDAAGGVLCHVARTFILTVTPGGIDVAVLNLDRLPLPSRQRAEIVLLGRDGRTVALEARTPYEGPHAVSWTVSGGTVDAGDGARVQWTLPEEAGIYQVELVLDYGVDGLAVDTMMLEVG